MLKALNEGELHVNHAALQFDVPTTTLKDRVAGRVIHDTNMGPTFEQ